MIFDPAKLIAGPEKIYFLAVNTVIGLSLFAVFIAIIIDFAEFQKREAVKKEKKSIVETGTMFAFFLLYYFLVREQIGRIGTLPEMLSYAMSGIGTIMVASGAVANVLGRLSLGKNWSNQIKIYEDHAFVSSGVYSLVRHPLYASIIWMFFGASLIFPNYLAFLALVFIFIPFMRYRARQEEVLLSKEFSGYKEYQKKVGMFFPKLSK